MLEEQLEACARAITRADGLLVTAGAGMGVDSGLPDFRGREGFWRAYPVLRKAGMDFLSIACPDTFRRDPRLAWGFYGHRLKLYRETIPHEGFAILQRLARHMPKGAFVFTSNVDGQFQKAGFSSGEICECHGSIHFLQCLEGCERKIWAAERFDPVVDEVGCQLVSPLPVCSRCGDTARPNVLMFGDWGWLDFCVREQEARLKQWLATVTRLVIIEIGAGKHIPTVRHVGEFQEGFLIRINPREPELPSGRRGVGLPLSGLEGLQRIQAALESSP